jgi:hypothetical protein
VSFRSADTRAGQFAHHRFVKRRRAWRRRLWWAFPIVFLAPIAIMLPIGLVTRAPHRGFWIGVALGLGAGAAVLLFDSPPFHIEKWRIGSDGEKATARHLRPLLRKGWTLFNDIETEYENIDHVLVGPAGVSCSTQSAWPARSAWLAEGSSYAGTTITATATRTKVSLAVPEARPWICTHSSIPLASTCGSRQWSCFGPS